MKNLFAASLWLVLPLSFQYSWAAEKDTIVIYPGISDGNSAAIEGRVIEGTSDTELTASDRRRDNFVRTMDLMSNDERKLHPITVKFAKREWQVLTDQEGYFRIEVGNIKELGAGWHEVTGHTAEGEGKGRLLVVPDTNTQGVISDIDDTVQITEVNSKTRMLANTFMLNPMQRQAVPGIVPFYRQLAQTNTQPHLAPIIYLSASPRQLHGNIDYFLVHNDFPQGVLITKRVTDDSTSEPIVNQVAYKTAKIESILSQLPAVRFTLIGDDGEHDPEIYADIQRRFPTRISAIWIRKVNPDPKRTSIPGQGVLNEVLLKYVEVK